MLASSSISVYIFVRMPLTGLLFEELSKINSQNVTIEKEQNTIEFVFSRYSFLRDMALPESLDWRPAYGPSIQIPT